MIRIGPVVIPVAIILIVIGSLACGYLVYYGWRFFGPSRGLHREGAPPLDPFPPPLPEADPMLFAAPLPDEYYPPPVPHDQLDEYLERFDALILANRQRFAAIHEFVDAGFSSIRELESAA